MSISGSLLGQNVTNDSTNPVTIQILIVDDSSVNRKILQSALAKVLKKTDETSNFNYQIIYTQAANGEEAISLTEDRIRTTQANFDLIFMDNSMGSGISGTQATIAIRAIEAKTKLNNSNFQPSCILRYSTDYGVTYPGENAYIAKPVDRSNLIAVLRELPLFQAYPEIFNPSGSPLSAFSTVTPSPSPSSTTLPNLLEPKRAASAPPPKIGANRLNYKKQSQNLEHRTTINSIDEIKEKSEEEAHFIASQRYSAPTFSPSSLIEPLVKVDIAYNEDASTDPVTVSIRPLSHSSSSKEEAHFIASQRYSAPTFSPSSLIEPLVKVDIACNEDASTDPVTVSIRPLSHSSSSEETITLTAIANSQSAPTQLTLTSPPAPFTSRQEHFSTQATGSSATTATLLELFTNQPTNPRIHSPIPMRTTVSPVVSRTGTPDQIDSSASLPTFVGTHTSSLSGEMQFKASTFLANEQRVSPNNSPLLGLRTLALGRNSPFKSQSPTVSPGNSPSSLYSRRLNQRHPLAQTHFADSSEKKVEKIEVEAETTVKTNADKSSGTGFKITQ